MNIDINKFPLRDEAKAVLHFLARNASYKFSAWEIALQTELPEKDVADICDGFVLDGLADGEFTKVEDESHFIVGISPKGMSYAYEFQSSNNGATVAQGGNA